MGEVWTTLYKQRNGDVLITRGDGYVTSVGTWTRHGDVISAQHRIVYRDFPKTGQPIPEPVKTTTFNGGERSDGWWLTAAEDGREFRPLRSLTDLDFLAGLLTDRCFWDGHKWFEPEVFLRSLQSQ
jgi:hypothetical protein